MLSQEKEAFKKDLTSTKIKANNYSSILLEERKPNKYNLTYNKPIDRNKTNYSC